ncbi:MAG: hypothetical protein KC621_01395 [Myxococcales bacterium]|nr:hypothetical protein [Myxococcales bacterium]
MQREESKPPVEAGVSTENERPAERRRFERPRLRRLGALPAVTAAFGGSFSP